MELCRTRIAISDSLEVYLDYLIVVLLFHLKQLNICITVDSTSTSNI